MPNWSLEWNRLHAGYDRKMTDRKITKQTRATLNSCPIFLSVIFLSVMQPSNQAGYLGWDRKMTDRKMTKQTRATLNSCPIFLSVIFLSVMLPSHLDRRGLLVKREKTHTSADDVNPLDGFQ